MGLKRINLVYRGKRHHAFKHGLKDTSAYYRWGGMVSRCYSKNNNKYHRYGGRGITVCDGWRHDFMMFLSDMGHPPVGTTLDRIDNNGNYEPDNCRWATQKQQQNNRSNTRVLVYNGVPTKLTDVSRLCGVRAKLIRQRIDRDGLSVGLATTKYPYVVN